MLSNSSYCYCRFLPFILVQAGDRDGTLLLRCSCIRFTQQRSRRSIFERRTGMHPAFLQLYVYIYSRQTSRPFHQHEDVQFCSSSSQIDIHLPAVTVELTRKCIDNGRPTGSERLIASLLHGFTAHAETPGSNCSDWEVIGTNYGRLLGNLFAFYPVYSKILMRMQCLGFCNVPDGSSPRVPVFRLTAISKWAYDHTVSTTKLLQQ